MQTREHIEHIRTRTAHNNCPECRADCSRRFAGVTPFVHSKVPAEARHSYLVWARERLDAIRTKTLGGDSMEARRWQRDFMAALNNRISSHLPGQGGRKHAPEYAKYHLATYGDDWHYLNA